MRETRADTRTALLQALALHVLVFLSAFAGLLWTRSHTVEPAAGDPIEAELIDPSALSASMQRALQRKPEDMPQPVEQPVVEPEPEPEPLPQPVVEEIPPAPVPEPAPVEQEKVQRDAVSPEVAKVPKEQEQKRKQPEQVDLDAQRRDRLLAEIRKQREQATRERTQAEMRAQQLADARAQTPGASPASPPPGNRGTDPGLLAQYTAALQQAIVRQWTRPESVQLGQRCRISIRQLPGGEVVDVTIAPSCPFDALGRQSVERAVLKASPLPYAGFESVFDRNLTLNFVAEER